MVLPGEAYFTLPSFWSSLWSWDKSFSMPWEFVFSLSKSQVASSFSFLASKCFLDRSASGPGSHEKGRDLAVFPLAVPTIAGPGAIMAVILLTDNDVYSVPEQILTAVVLLVVLGLTYVLLLVSDAILRAIGRQGAAILVRVMGILLAALSVELVLSALGIGPWATPKH